jgi:hypothetical protein
MEMIMTAGMVTAECLQNWFSKPCGATSGTLDFCNGIAQRS